MSETKLQDIREIAKKLELEEDDFETYGRYMAKLSLSLIKKTSSRGNGNLILVTSMNPTPAGEGKTTTSIGLGQAFQKLGKKVAIALREPSLGPCFGIKGGATGGGKSIVEPSDSINLLFTSDFPAVSAAHNLLSALINNHIHHGNSLNIDPKNILFPRTIDMNDRSLREIVVGVGGRENGTMATEKFVITPASEIMAILALSLDYADLKNRLSKILVGYSFDKKPIYAGDLNAQGSMAALLRDAIKPNLVQTTEGVPAFVHTGPFGNIAHGTSSIIADKIGLKLVDYLITEAGFGSDLGAEKFLDLVSRAGEIPVSAVVIVSTIRAIKHHGGAKDYNTEDLEALKLGSSNILHHVNNVKNFGFDPVVAVNLFPSDTANEIELLEKIFDENKVTYALSEVFTKGGEGGLQLAEKVLSKIGKPEVPINYAYSFNDNVKDKITAIAKRVYGADGVDFDKKALSDLRRITKLGLDHLPICMAKTQYSLSDDPSLLNTPKGFSIKVTSVSISSGAGFIVPYLGEIMTMPGLPKKPAAENIDVTDEGEITGLF